MSICIVAATSLELQHLPAASEQYNIQVTGLGTAATVYHLMQKLHNSRPSLVIQAGIAGSFDENIPLGQAVVVREDRFADLGVNENDQWNDIFDMKLAEANAHPYTNGWLINPHRDLLNTLQLPIVKGITINEVTTHPLRVKQLREKYAPVIESMEGAAFHYVCLQQAIPFIQLRTVSNYIGERNKSKWQLARAIENLAAQIEGIVRRVS